jgi:hypothetical protein
MKSQPAYSEVYSHHQVQVLCGTPGMSRRLWYLPAYIISRASGDIPDVMIKEICIRRDGMILDRIECLLSRVFECRGGPGRDGSEDLYSGMR